MTREEGQVSQKKKNPRRINIELLTEEEEQILDGYKMEAIKHQTNLRKLMLLKLREGLDDLQKLILIPGQTLRVSKKRGVQVLKKQPKGGTS